MTKTDIPALQPLRTPNMHIRDERPSDIVAIEAVTIAAFKQAVHSEHTEQFIVRELRNAAAMTISLVAEDNDAVIGHVAISPVSLSGGETSWYRLGPVSVAPERQNNGIGSQLVRTALVRLQGLGAAGCVVLGDPGYYSRFGFKPSAQMQLPGVPAEYFQMFAFNGEPPAGTVAYHPAFTVKA